MAYQTEQRKVLAEFLMTHPDGFYTPQEIYESLGSEAISLSAVYRNIAALEKDGSIVRRPTGNKNESSYRYVHGKNCRGHIHIVCEKCGKVAHVPQDLSEYVEKSFLSAGFRLDKAKTMLYGICADCAK